MAITTKDYERWRGEYGAKGHEMEEKTLAILTSRIGVTLVDRNLVGKKLDYEAACRSTPREDFEQGFDHYFYSPKLDEWLKIDITISTDPETHAEKRAVELEKEIVHVPLRKRDIEEGYLGGERGITRVAESYASSLKAFVETRSQEAKAQPEVSPLPA